MIISNTIRVNPDNPAENPLAFCKCLCYFEYREEKLRNHTTPETADEYTQQLRKLYEHLSSIKFIWEHEFNFSMDELADVMSEMFSGKPAAYRATRRFER